MSNQVKLIFFQYLTPLLYAVVLYFIHIAPNDGDFASVVLFLIGFYLGNALMWLDGVALYPYYNPLRTEPKQLLTRSVIFILAFIPVTLFVLTSSGSLLGSGLVFAIGLTLASEIFLLRHDAQAFHYHFLSQLKRQLTDQELMRVVWAFCGFMVLSSIIFFF